MKVFSYNQSNSISGHTGLTCLLGSPVAHSISPAMHNESFRLLGLDFAYLAFDVTEQTFAASVEGLKALGAKGWNCTMPLKRLMHDRADVLSETARLIGAVNTVVNRDGILYGYNTDGYGFFKSMSDAGFQIPGRKLTLLGAGGASAAILGQAAIDKASAVDVFARPGSASTRELEKEIARIQRASDCAVSLYDLADKTQLKRSIQESFALINASSVGMAPHTDASLITDPAFLFPGLIVGDVIYNPRETRLLQMARERGCSVFNGMYMLLHQGALAFQLWTGQDMPVEHIRQAYFQ